MTLGTCHAPARPPGLLSSNVPLEASLTAPCPSILSQAVHPVVVKTRTQVRRERRLPCQNSTCRQPSPFVYLRRSFPPGDVTRISPLLSTCHHCHLSGPIHRTYRIGGAPSRDGFAPISKNITHFFSCGSFEKFHRFRQNRKKKKI